MYLSAINPGNKFFGPLFKRGINRKHRKRNKKKVTNYTILSKRSFYFTAMEQLRA